jgi:GTPase SAR1 family protein
VLEQWIISDRCRLVTLLGMGGIGKTWLLMKLATEIQEQFEFVIWRTLRNAPPVKDMVAHLLQVFSTDPSTHLPETVEGRVSRTYPTNNIYAKKLKLIEN